MSGEDQSKVVLGPDNPWPGLNQFSENHDRYFRGRDEEKAELFRLVKGETLTILFGKSGLGKSSLLQAGLFPLLRQAGYLPVFIHIRYDDPAANDRDNAPPLASQVYAALREACTASNVEAPEIHEEETLWEYFHRAGASFWNERNRLVTPVLVFDQFEEAFTLGVEDDRRRKQRDSFLTQLEDLIENRPPQKLRERWDKDPELVSGFKQDRTPCKIILSLREDFLPELEQLKEKIRSIMHNRFRLERMDGGKAWQVVTGETIVDGEPRRALSHLVDEEVALKIIDFVSKTRGKRGEDPLTRETLRARTVDPALLSVVCSELNNRRRATQPPQDKISFTLLSDSKEEIIREFFDGHVNALGAGAGPVRRFIEEELITGSGFRKRCDMEDALRQQGVTRDDLRRLEQQRILRFEPSEGITWIELTHDLLTEVVYTSRLRRREREERAKAEAEAAARRKKNRMNRAIAGVAIWVVVLTIASIAMFLMWKEAEKARQDAVASRQEAVEARGEADEARRKAEWSWQQAEKYFVQYIAEKIAHQLSESPPDVASAQLFARGAWELGISKQFPYEDYAAAISMFGEPTLFAPKTILKSNSPIRQIGYSADGRLGVLDDDGDFRILDLNVSKDLRSTPPLHDRVAAFSFHPRGKPIVALRRADDEKAILLDYEHNKQIELQLDEPSATGFWEPVRAILVTSEKNKERTLPSQTDAQPSSNGTTGDEPPKETPKMSIAFSPYSSGGDLLAIAARDGKVHIFNVGELASGDGAKGVELTKVAYTRVQTESSSGSDDDPLPIAKKPATAMIFIQIGPMPQLVTAHTDGVWIWPKDDGSLREFEDELTHERLVKPATVRENTETAKENTETDAISPISLSTSALGWVMCIAPYDVTNGAVFFRDRPAWPDPSLSYPGREWDQIPLQLPAAPTSAACAPDGELVAVSVTSNLVKLGAVYVFRRGEMLQRLDHDDPVKSIAFRPDARALACASGSTSEKLPGNVTGGTVTLWELSRDGPHSMARQPALATKVALSPNGHWLASLENDRIRLRNASTGKLERETKVGNDPVALAVNDDRHVFALTSDGNEVKRRDVFDGGKAVTWPNREILALSPDAKWAVCTNANGAFEIVTDSGESKAIALRQTAPMVSDGVISAENVPEKGVVAISPSGGLIAAYDAFENKINLCANPWLPRTEDGATLASHTNPWNSKRKINAYANPALSWSGGPDSLPYYMPNPWDIWQWRFREPTMRLKSKIECKQELKHLAFAPSERLLFATTENDLLVFDLEMGSQIFQRAAGGAVTALSISGSGTGSTLALAMQDQPLRVWGSAPAPNSAEREKSAELKKAEFEKIAGVTFKDFDLIPRKSEPEAHAAMDTAAASFWTAFWETGRRVAGLTGESSAKDLEKAYAPLRQALERGEPTHCWQAALMRKRLEVMPPWAPADAEVLRARLDAVDDLEAPERVILLEEGIVPFVKDHATLFGPARFRLAFEHLSNNEKEVDPIQELTEVLAAGYTNVDEILRTWSIESDVRYADIIEKELLPRIPVDRKTDRLNVFVVLAQAYAEAWSRVNEAEKDPPRTHLDLAFNALEQAVDLGFDDWGTNWGSLRKLNDDPRFKRLLSTAIDREPNSFQANFFYGSVVRMDGSVSRDSAAAVLDRAAELANSPVERSQVQVEKGRLWTDAREWKKALDAIDAALKENPNNGAAKRMRRIVLEKLESANQ